jgi:hypothetical protein
MQKTITGVSVKDADKGTVEAVFSTFNVIDKDGDVTVPGAIKDGTKVVISAYGHTSWQGMLPVGKGVIKTTDTEAIIQAQFFLDTTHGSDTFKTVKALAESGQGEWSYSLRNVTQKMGEFQGEPANFLESIEVNEVSPVLVGAGVNTRTLNTKGLKFADEGETVLTALESFVGRASEVMVLRSAKGRSLSAESTDLLKRVEGQVAKLADLLAEPESPGEASLEDMAALKRIQTDRLRAELFSNLPKGA